jgi:hypothetical protein
VSLPVWLGVVPLNSFFLPEITASTSCNKYNYLGSNSYTLCQMANSDDYTRPEVLTAVAWGVIYSFVKFTSVLEEHTATIFRVNKCLLGLLFNPANGGSSFL